MAEQQGVSKQVAIRLLLLIIGTIFLWNAIPSHRWTRGASPLVQTGLWTTCSCTVVKDRDNCRAKFTPYDKETLVAQNNATGNITDFKDIPRATRKDAALAGGKYLFTKNVKDNGNLTGEIKKDSDRCDQWGAAGATALVCYLMAILSVFLLVKNVAGNVLPVLNQPVLLCVVFSGIFGLITSALFGDLYNVDNLGSDFGMFTFGWLLMLFVGFTSLQDLRASVTPTDSASSLRAILLVFGLTALSFSMGTSWRATDQQDVYVPTGEYFGLNKNNNSDFLGYAIKEGNFFMSAYSIPEASLQAVFKAGEAKGDIYPGPSNQVVRNGDYRIDLWQSCVCKSHTSTECSLLGSDWYMFQNKGKKCDIFQAARIFAVITGLLAFLSLCLSSALIGGLRRVASHITSNTLATVAALTGFIATILVAVLYDSDDLSSDFGLFTVGWVFCLFASLLGGPTTAYYREVQERAQVVPMQPSQNILARVVNTVEDTLGGAIVSATDKLDSDGGSGQVAGAMADEA